MINSIPTATNTFPQESASSPLLIKVWFYRLLILSIGSSLAAVLGIALATLYPNPNPERPVFIEVWQRLKAGTGFASTDTPVELEKKERSLQLTAAQTQQMEAQLQQLQIQAKELSDRITTLETQLGEPQPTEPLENRLQTVSQQLQQVAVVDKVNLDQPVASKASVVKPDTFKVTLPNDLLFNDKYSVMRPESALILDPVINDLRHYPKATIRIAAHTDAINQPEDSREISFRRAQAIEQYLSAALGDKYRWVVIGYGETRPLVANDTDLNRQRNRRIEISIDPKVNE